jgi:hypothetical protein
MEGPKIPEAPVKKIQVERKPVNILNEPVEERPSEFKVFGFEMIDREVKQSGNTGRVYLPKNWIGSRVKIIRASKLERKEEL